MSGLYTLYVMFGVSTVFQKGSRNTAILLQILPLAFAVSYKHTSKAEPLHTSSQFPYPPMSSLPPSSLLLLWVQESEASSYRSTGPV